MPLGQLSRVERERLGRFPATIAGDDLREFFELKGATSIFVRSRRGDSNRLGLAIQLGCLRFLGFVPDLDTVPAEVIGFVARQLEVPAALEGYGQREQTRSVVMGLGLLMTLTSLDNAGGLGFTGYLAVASVGLAITGIGAVCLALGRILSVLSSATASPKKTSSF